MRQNPRFRTLMDSTHVKRSEKLLKAARQYFCPISSERKSAIKILF